MAGLVGQGQLRQFRRHGVRHVRIHSIRRRTDNDSGRFFRLRRHGWVKKPWQVQYRIGVENVPELLLLQSGQAKMRP